jgi:predicted metal-dependent enzyme (double-stranded beta helix superfamily)
MDDEMDNKMDLETDMSVTLQRDNVVTPFPGDPAAAIRKAARARASYGLQPGATRLVDELASTMRATLQNCQPHALAAAAKASLRGYLCEPKLLNSIHRRGGPDGYTRHLLYADPERQFSILAIVWRAGQCTPIHGHTAWGAVGVLAGNPYCEIFDTSCDQQPRLELIPTMKMCLHEGDLATVQPGIDDVHRIGNEGLTEAITIHIYGRDLLASPGSINITFN